MAPRVQLPGVSFPPHQPPRKPESFCLDLQSVFWSAGETKLPGDPDSYSPFYSYCLKQVSLSRGLLVILPSLSPIPCPVLHSAPAAKSHSQQPRNLQQASCHPPVRHPSFSQWFPTCPFYGLGITSWPLSTVASSFPCLMPPKVTKV